MFYDEELGYDVSEAYCTNGDGELAYAGVPIGMAGNRPVMQMYCVDCLKEQGSTLVEV